MAHFPNPPLGFLTRATNTAWQDQLRVSVRLYLSLNADPAIEAELEALLRRNEQELLDYLLAGELPTPDERQRAQEFLDRAQHQLLAELSAESGPTLTDKTAGGDNVSTGYSASSRLQTTTSRASRELPVTLDKSV